MQCFPTTMKRNNLMIFKNKKERGKRAKKLFKNLKKKKFNKSLNFQVKLNMMNDFNLMSQQNYYFQFQTKFLSIDLSQNMSETVPKLNDKKIDINYSKNINDKSMTTILKPKKYNLTKKLWMSIIKKILKL